MPEQLKIESKEHTIAAGPLRSISISQNISADEVAKKLEQYFVSDHGDLVAALALFAFGSLAEFLKTIGEFFNERFDLDNLTREEIEDLDYKGLAYAFANKLKIERPLVSNKFIKSQVVSIYAKLGRLFIHEILFPELAKIDPKLALSVKNQMKRAVGAVAIIEGVEKSYAYDLLKIDDVNIDCQVSLLPPKAMTAVEGRRKNYGLMTVYFKTILTEGQVDKLAKTLKSSYGIIFSVAEFRGLIFSDGQWDGSLKIRKSKQKTFAWLMAQMCKPENKSEPKFIFLNKGGGYWKLLQGLVIDENEEWLDCEFAKICNEIRNDDTEEHHEIKRVVEEILKPYRTRS